MLVLTDHSEHSNENALYALVLAMKHHPHCAGIDIATRGNPANAPFFKAFKSTTLEAVAITEEFKFQQDGHFFKQDTKWVAIEDYDVVWLRLPPALSHDFLQFLKNTFPEQLFINDPAGIDLTGSKAFLLNFPEYCAPMKACYSLEDIIAYKKEFPIVLKPFRDYGGKGIVRIDGEQVWIGKETMSFSEFTHQLKGQPIEYLAVKYLKNVSQGDKRIVVVCGEIMGASLRLPAEDSWLCNVAMGGSSNLSYADEREKEMVRKLDPALSDLGIVMYGLDTLVGDDGQRVLSEINTTSIGGLPQIAKLTGEPLLEKAAALMWNYIALNLKK
jgi:glutathione synthase